jgi:hypothetical protein
MNALLPTLSHRLGGASKLLRHVLLIQVATLHLIWTAGMNSFGTSSIKRPGAIGPPRLQLWLWAWGLAWWVSAQPIC